jgi:hypothetical protein
MKSDLSSLDNTSDNITTIRAYLSSSRRDEVSDPIPPLAGLDLNKHFPLRSLRLCGKPDSERGGSYFLKGVNGVDDHCSESPVELKMFSQLSDL